MYIDDYDFTHQDQTLLRDMPEEIICLDCQEPYVSIVFKEHATTETLITDFANAFAKSYVCSKMSGTVV